MSHLLCLTNITLSYHTLQNETLALSNINLTVDEQEFVAIVGPSGCGKTTLLSLISGIIHPSSGVITLRGEKLLQNKGKIGYMFQRDLLFEWRTVWQNILLGLELKKEKTPQNIEFVTQLLQKYGLYEFKDKFPRHLSGGMRQRVALIRTLALSPDILLLDEPFGALDYQTRQSVIADVNNIIRKERKTSILVTHDIGEAVSLADRIVVLSKRPSTVKAEFKTNLTKIKNIEDRKKTTQFKSLVDKIWEVLE